MPPAGRPKAFDEVVVLERAMDLFWLHGYHGLGVSELLEGMGISRQSLYDTFGNKRGLFLRAIGHYRATQLAQALALLERDGSPLDNVRAVVSYFEGLAKDERARGCLVANTLVELGPHDEEVAAVLQETLGLLEGKLRSALEQARSAGELPNKKSPRQLSWALLNSMLGMAVAGKLRLDPQALADVYAGTLSMLS